jgi:capsular exopolysaccharide synthesis family protein
MQFEPALNQSAKSIATLEDYIEAVRRRKVLVAALALTGLLFGLWTTSRSVKQYRTSARVVVSPTPVGSTNNGLIAPNLEREAALLVSDEVAGAARSAAGDGIGFVSAKFTPLSDVLSVSATSTNPAYAAKLATAYVNEYVSKRVAAQKAFYVTSHQQLTDVIGSVKTRIAEQQAKLVELDKRRSELAAAATAPGRTQELEAIANDRNNVSTAINYDQSRIVQLEAQLAESQRAELTQLPAASVISAAGVPGTPTGIKPPILWIVFAMLGLVVGVVSAFLRERLDRRAAASRDVELALGGQVLGAVPKFGLRNRSGKWALVMANDVSGHAAASAREAYRRIRSSVQFMMRADNVKRFVVTSHRPSEGKSTTAANIAISLALGGSRVALLSADLRRSSLERTFGIDNDRGLSSFLSGTTDTLRQERVANLEDLVLIPAGPEPANPGELLGSARFAQVLEWLSRDFDVVIVDTPPLSVAADALAAANGTDGMIVVVDGEKTETTDLLAIRGQIDRSGNKLLGAIINRDTSVKKSWFRRNTTYGYYSDSPPPPSRRGQLAPPTVDELVTR